MWFYGDPTTRELLRSERPIALLYGGFEGFDNYGDILQLKGAIAFHRERTGLEPIPVLAMAAWTGPGLTEAVRRDYGVEGVIYEDGERLDARDFDLQVITDVMAGNLLHVYGGGYLNRFWGERRAFIVEQLAHRFHVAEWVISGQQVDRAGIAGLRRLMKEKPPLLAAGRDAASTALLRSIVPAGLVHDSFDDAIEPILGLHRALVGFGGTSAPVGIRNVGLHLNITEEYMPAEQGGRLRAVADAVRAAAPDAGWTLLHAYNDRRSLIQDTVQAADRLGVLASSIELDVLNLATLAARPELRNDDLRRLHRTLASIDFVISASYHVALTMQLLGKPAYLVSTNEYYDAKRTALGLETDLEVFLADPRAALRDFAGERRQRTDWLDLLQDTIAGALAPGWREPATTLNAPASGRAPSAARRYLHR